MSEAPNRFRCSQVTATCSPMGDRVQVDLSLTNGRGEETTLTLDGDEALEVATQILATLGEVIAHQQRTALTLH